MEEKINVAELLKDCPKGMELDCTMFEDVKFISVEEDDKPICIRTGDIYRYLTKFGTWTFDDNAKCVIFPKGKTTWKWFVPPCEYKAGDVLVSQSGNIVLLSHIDSKNIVHYHCIIPICGNFRIEENTSIGVGKYYQCYLANEQQRQRMYDRIKCSGYKYNQHINKLEKLIVPKFDIILLKPFDKVLVRDENLLEDSDITDATWSAALYSHNKFGDNAYPYVTTNGHFAQCVPYIGNEYLLGTTDDCDEYYKTWD